MLAGDFQRKLRKLNRNLRIYCKDNNDYPAGIFHVVRGEFTEICGIDKNIVNEHSVLAGNGAIIRGGWRRALRILINKGLVKREDAEREFGKRLHYKGPRRKKPVVNIPSNMFKGR